ncbi:MAG: hypothetical protein ABJQ71_07575 [Roseibium sp.]
MLNFKSSLLTILAPAFVIGALSGSANADWNGEESESPGWVQKQAAENARALEQLRKSPVLILKEIGDWNGEESETPGWLQQQASENAGAGQKQRGSALLSLKEIGDWNGEEPETPGWVQRQAADNARALGAR